MSLLERVGEEQDKVYINVGGKHHESYISTLRNIPDTRLAWMAESLMSSQDETGKRKELFFDRHPDIFAIILNYYRTGKLHAPRDVCGPLFQEELQFWGIEEMEMEACCWPNYTQHREAEKNLKDFVGPEFEEEEGEEDGSHDRQNYGSVETRPSLWHRYQEKIWAVMEDAFSSVKAKIFALVSLLMIVVSVLLMCAASLPEIRTIPERKLAFQRVEYFFCAWFTLEFALRFIFCPHKVEFFKQVMTWIDIISLVPYYRKIFWHTTDVDFLRAIRLIRLFRAFRFFTFTSGLQIIVQSLKASIRELLLLVIILLIPVVLFSSVVYEFEKDKQPIKFNSIPQTFWWAVITMTTVGYGDMSPATVVGQLIGSLCAICGVLIIGLPVSVIGNNFSTYYEHAQARLSLPKKKRRLIIADHLKLMQGQSNSSDERVNEEESEHHDSDDNAPDGMPRNYRRYHYRARNTIFARGDVYIGQVKSSRVPNLDTQVEGSTNEVDCMEKGDLSTPTDNAISNPKARDLVNSKHKSDGTIEERLANKSPNSKRDSSRKTRETKSMIELKSLDRPPSRSSTSPKQSRHSFRSRISPTPKDLDCNCGESSEKESKPMRRPNTSLTLPPLTVLTYAKSKADIDEGNESNYGSKDSVQMDKNSDMNSNKDNCKSCYRTRNGHQNGDVPRGS